MINLPGRDLFEAKFSGNDEAALGPFQRYLLAASSITIPKLIRRGFEGFWLSFILSYWFP